MYACSEGQQALCTTDEEVGSIFTFNFKECVVKCKSENDIIDLSELRKMVTIHAEKFKKQQQHPVIEIINQSKPQYYHQWKGM